MTARDVNPELFEECQDVIARGKQPDGTLDLDDLEPGEAGKLMDMIALHWEFEG